MAAVTKMRNGSYYGRVRTWYITLLSKQPEFGHCAVRKRTYSMSNVNYPCTILSPQNLRQNIQYESIFNIISSNSRDFFADAAQ